MVLKATESDWANSRLRVGLELASDFDDVNRFALKMMHVRSSLNSWGGELRTVAQVGDQRGLGMQFFQPLGPGSPWYIAPSTQYGSTSVDMFNNGLRQRRLAYTERSVTMVVGRELGTWGDFQAGIARLRVGARPVIPQDPFGGSAHGYATSAFLRYRIDTLDSLGFPSRGNLFEAEIGRQPDADGFSSGGMAVVGMKAFRTQNWAGHVYGEYARAQQGKSPITLGGFLRLSGTATDSVDGRSVAFARMVMARRIGALPVTLGGTVRAGFSIEAGGGFDQDKPSRERLFKQAFSGFLSVDTRFGPAYVGAGITREGNGTAYIFLGPIW